MNSVEQVESTEEQKSVKDALLSAYEKNISTKLKAELCNLDVNNFVNTKEASASKFSFVRFYLICPTLVLRVNSSSNL